MNSDAPKGKGMQFLCQCWYMPCYVKNTVISLKRRKKDRIVNITYCTLYLTYLLYVVNKYQRILKGQSKMDNPEKLGTQGTQDEDKENKNTT